MSEYKIPNRLVDIKNTDKAGWSEKWTPSRAKDLANFPHPSRIALIGPPSTGKSFICKHLIMHQRPMFKEVYIIHGDADVTTEYEDIEPTMIMHEVPPVDFWDSKVKTLCILDDVEYSNISKDQMARLNKLFRYVSSHKNVTLYVTHQNFFELPTLVRKLCTTFILWKPRSTTELKLIANRIGLKPETLTDIFENHCPSYRDSICVDFNIGTPSVFRKNLWEPLNIDSAYNDLVRNPNNNDSDIVKKLSKMNI
jgi:hypothetical protein